MNTELVRKWVEALRSGDYKQGKQALRNKYNEYCCLGVLCDISKKHLGIDWKLEKDSDSDYFEAYTMEKSGGVLPNSVWEYLGKEVDFKVNISTSNSKIPSIVTKSSLYSIFLVTLNDVYELSFNQIADILEEEFLNEN